MTHMQDFVMATSWTTKLCVYSLSLLLTDCVAAVSVAIVNNLARYLDVVSQTKYVIQ